jgi:hypothetical protein
MQTKRLFRAAVVTVVALAATSAWGASADDLIAEAEKLRTAGKVEEAAARFGAALESAQKKGKLDAEERAARGLDGLFGPGTVGGRAGGGVTAGERDLLALVLGQLDATRNGAFVSAPVVARKLLLFASEFGDADHVAPARAALVANGKAGGRASSAMVTYADGLLALEAGDSEAAGTAFEQVLAVALEERWADVAAHASAEIAGIRVAAADEAGAKAVLARVTETLEGELGGLTSSAWTRVLHARIGEPSTELLNVLRAAMRGARPTSSGPVVSDGGYGKSKSTELGRALKRFSVRKPLVTARCAPNGFALTRHFEPESEEVRLFRPDQQRIDYGGLLVTTRGRMIALQAAKTENEGASGIGGVTRSVASSVGVGSVARAEYLLARGETWGVTKKGVVTITAP